MRRTAALALLLAGTPGLSGCIAAAALPLAAAGSIAKTRLSNDRDAGVQTAPSPAPTPMAGQEAPVAPIAPPADRDVPEFKSVQIINGPLPTPEPSFKSVQIIDGPMPVPGGPAPAASTVPAQGASPGSTPPAGMQFLYGSGEGAALSIQAFRGLWRYLSDRIADRKADLYIRSVILSREGTLEAPRFLDCGNKPLAAVFDVDETLVLNLGFEADDAQRGTGYDEARWQRWEQSGSGAVAAVPGAVETIEEARRAGITIVFNSNRSKANAAGTIAALRAAGLGNAELGKTLWLRDGGSGKDERRWEIGAKYCVVALVGDQLGDFSDLFNPKGVSPAVRRNLASETMVAPLWGSGWFVLPNPVYGTGLKGSFDEVFPRDKRWTDPGPAPAEVPNPQNKQMPAAPGGETPPVPGE